MCKNQSVLTSEAVRGVGRPNSVSELIDLMKKQGACSLSYDAARTVQLRKYKPFLLGVVFKEGEKVTLQQLQVIRAHEESDAVTGFADVSAEPLPA